MKKLFLARPSFNITEPESESAARNAVLEDSWLAVVDAQFRQSMTCNNFNNLLCACLNAGDFDYFAMLHADVTAEDGWAQTLVEQMELHDFDVIHAPVKFKNRSGKSSTAVAFCDSHWAPVRRIMSAELPTLPRTFGVEVLRDTFDARATRLLPNTGCMVWRLGEWAKKFPGYTMLDRIVEHNGKWYAPTISEDYLFGHWCADNGIRVGATQIRTGHVGRDIFWSDEVSGPETDEQYLRECKEVREAQLA